MSSAIGTQTKVTWLAALVIALGSAHDAAAALIPVTTLQQKTNGVGACSLQEAIYSANYDDNIAINGYSGSTQRVVRTQCVAGSGDDTIVLPSGATLEFSRIVDDVDNPTGPTANPIITSRITLLAYGATLRRTSVQSFRLFAIATSGALTIRRAYITGFSVKAGNGDDGGGGGMGAGGAIYVMAGALVIEESTIEGNSAYGGIGGSGVGGGGGGIGGNGGRCNGLGGGGGGGARGNGASCSGPTDTGGGGGGTLSNAALREPGFDCGGRGGFGNSSGQNAQCFGGGGGGAGDTIFRLPGEDGADGGRGEYGGGGGGGTERGVGGRAGFGGGGGASGFAGAFGEDGGNGGFGGGGGAGNDGFVTSGDAGNGGFLAGDGGSSAGGGGAGLGGAIFNDRGAVDIRNSTFTGNFVYGGFSEHAQDGVSGGGAILSRRGSLTILNSTITGNEARIGGGILVVQDSDSAPTTIVLENTILANNGAHECAITGEDAIAAAFVGNLITSNTPDGFKYAGNTFFGCQGIVATDDPQLGPLQYNLGTTPTMAITASSPAHDAADPASSLTVDQRRSRRPSGGGFDIGAFELCESGLDTIGRRCGLLTGPIFPFPIFTPDAVLDIQVQPPGGGTTTPSPGPVAVDFDTVVPLTAIANPGFRFVTWSNNVANPAQASTTIFVQGSQTVTAYFEACSCAADVTSVVGVALGGVTLNPITKRYVQTVTLTNNSAATLSGPISLVLNALTAGVTLWNASGTTNLMLPAGSSYINAATNLAPGQSIALQLQFTNSGNVAFSYSPRVLAGPGSR